MRFTKKLLMVALMLMLILSFALTIVFANEDIAVTIDGQAVVFADQQPVIIDGRTLVPVGGVFDALGFVPTWEGAIQTATLTRDDFTIVITIGSSTFTTNNVAHTLDVPAQIIGGRTMLPIRAVLESVRYTLEWDGATRTVIIKSPMSEISASHPDPDARAIGLLSSTFLADGDDEQALYWARLAADGGDAIGQNVLGVLYLFGDIVIQNHERAAELFYLAAEQGFAPAMTNLGNRYRLGQGVSRNYARAVELYRAAAEQGFPLGQHSIGYMYFYGLGIDVDLYRALHWGTLAVEQGISFALASFEPIDSHLGVGYTILPQNHTFTHGDGYIRWQFLVLDDELDLTHFEANQYVPAFINAEIGDVFIITWPSGDKFMYIVLGFDEAGIMRTNEQQILLG